MLCVPRILAVQNKRAGRPLDEHDLADLAQDVLLLVWKKLPSFEGASALETWVYSFCYLQFMNASRRKARLRTRASDEAPAEAAADPQESGRFEELYEGVESLPPAERRVIELRLSSELTFDEIGRASDEPVSTVKSRYYKAIQRLAAFLRRRGEPAAADEQPREEAHG